MVGRLAPWMDRFRGRGSAAGAVFTASRDMRDYDRIRELVHWADEQLDRGSARELTLNLSRLVHMDTSFLAGIVLVCRRARAKRTPVRIVKFPKNFEALVDLYRVRTALRDAGVIFEDPIEGERKNDAGAEPASSSTVSTSESQPAPSS